MDWQDTDRIMKFMKGSSMTEKALQLYAKNRDELLGKFQKGTKKVGMSSEEAEQLFDDMTCYTFNKGHGVGYSLISIEEMFYKVYYPNDYWFAKLKYAKDDAEFHRFCEKAVADGSVVFLPHVNYSKAKTSLRKVEGENAIQQGLTSIKGVGEKAADFIMNERKENGVFINYDDFYDRCKCRVVTTRVISLLEESGALEFKKKTYINRVTKYNSALFARGDK